MLLALAEALQSRDAYSGAHSLRVAALAGTVAERLGWDEARLTRLRVGALLHDIGKLAIPRRILRKAGPLTSSELTRIRFHPVAGALAELDRCAGTQFEPAVVRAFLEACDAGDVDLRRLAS